MFYTCASPIGNNNTNNNNCYGYIAPGKADRNWQLPCRDVKSSAKRKPATHAPRRACRAIASNLRREDEKKAPEIPIDTMIFVQLSLM